MNEIIITAATVEEAMAEARKKYSSSDTDLSFDILQMPKKGFLGIGAQPAKVKVTVTKSLPDVDLSSLVSDIRNMKIDEPEEKPKQNQQKPQQKQGQQGQQKPVQKQQNPPKQNPPKAAEPKQNPPAAQPKPQPKPQPQPAVKPAEAKSAPAEDSVPVALRKPAERREPPKKQDKKQKQQRPADNRPADEKKKDLLSAVMGVKEEKKAAADFHTVTESASPKADTRWEKFTDAVEEKWEAVEEKFEAVGDRAEEIADSIEDKLEAAIGRLTGGSDDEPVKKEDTRRMEFVTPEEMQYALDFANTLFANMNLPAKAVHNPDARGEEIPEGTVAARIDIVGDDSGILIGHHGETLDAIQYLVNLCASRKSESAKREFVKIVVDIEGYRGKREDTLRALARRMAAKAVKYKRNVVLEPMNPYERRIIHSEVQGIENVSTHSVGSDENRKIVITYEGADKAPKKGGRNDRRRKKSGENRDTARAEKPAREENTEKTGKTDRSDRPRVKPVRAKSIDDVRLDLSEESSVTLGSIGTDTEDTEEVVETRIREY